MAQSKGDVGAGKYRRRLYIRKTASYTRPTSLATLASLLGTADEMGIFDDKTIKWGFDDGDIRPLNDASDYVQEHIGRLDASLANFIPGNVDDFETEYDNVNVDVFLDDPDRKDFVALLDFRIHGKDDETSGDKGAYLIWGKKKVKVKSSFKDRFDYSAFI